MRWEDRNVHETRAEVCHLKLRGFVELLQLYLSTVRFGDGVGYGNRQTDAETDLRLNLRNYRLGLTLEVALVRPLQ